VEFFILARFIILIDQIERSCGDLSRSFHGAGQQARQGGVALCFFFSEVVAGGRYASLANLTIALEQYSGFLFTISPASVPNILGATAWLWGLVVVCFFGMSALFLDAVGMIAHIYLTHDWPQYVSP